MNTRLHGCFTLRSPLSHISESIGPNAYLVQEPLRQNDGTFVEVFCYSGNAWRGHLRDMCAVYMLERLGNPKIPLDSFHLLFSGGKIGGDQAIRLDQARTWRRAVPMLAIFGGGIGNQILPGKLRVSNSYPVCREAAVALPRELRGEASAASYSSMTFEKSFSRKDDAKNVAYDDFHAGETQPALLEDKSAKPRKTADDEVATQMRMTVELVAAGVQLYSEIDALGVNEIELGALVSALHAFSRSPFIGGQSNKGHGRVELDYAMLDLDTGETREFLSIADGPARLAPPAEAAKQAYDAYLREQYDKMLATNGGEILHLIGAK